MKETGTITINLEGVSFEETEKCRRVLHTLISQGLFNIRNGSMNLHFDFEGTLQEIEVHLKKWKKNKPDLDLHKLLDGAIIEVLQSNTSTRTPSGASIR